jgi:DegV family protein with EDD domain
MGERFVNHSAIIADSVACITKEQAEKYNISIIPANIFYNGKVYRDWKDLSSAQAYEFLDQSPDFWKSSAATPEEYMEIYRELGAHAQNILVVTISAKLSMFYSSARYAREFIEPELPNTRIDILDSRTVAAAEGLVVLAAARAIEQGKSFNDVVAVAEAVSEKVKFIGLLETLRYVYRTGRIPKTAARLGSMVPVKPILTGSNGTNGVIHLATAARSKKTGVDKMIHMMKEHVATNESVHVAVMHADTYVEAENLKDIVANEFNCQEIYITDFSPIMGCATGRGTLGLAFYKS